MASKKRVQKPIVNSGRHLSPAAKAVVLGHAMETAAMSLTELSQLCRSLGEEALSREAETIRDALLSRTRVLLTFSRQAGKSLPLEKMKS